MTDLIDWYETYRQEMYLLGYLLVTLLPGVFLAEMLTRALVRSGLALSVHAFFQVVGLTSLALASVLFGLYVGFLVLLYIDFKKRAQSLILGVVTLIAVVVMAFEGRFVANMSGIDVAFFVVGLVGGIVVAGGPKLHYLEVNDARELIHGRVITKGGRTPLEFREAERYIYVMLVAVIAVGFVEAHLQYPPLVRFVDAQLQPVAVSTFSIDLVDTGLVAQDLVAALLFSFALGLFLGYDTDTRLFILGPPGSGKTHIPIGMYLAANDSDLHVWGAGSGLPQLIREMSADEDFANRTFPDDIQNIGFQYATTGYFPRNVIVDALDYPGEYLPHIPDGLQYLRGEISDQEFRRRIANDVQSGEATKENSPEPSHEMADGGASPATDDRRLDSDSGDAADPTVSPEAAEDVEGDEVERAVEIRFADLTSEILPRVQAADTLLLTLDLERFQYNEQLHTNYYNEIMDQLQSIEDSPAARVKGFLGQETALGPLKAEKVVATKADFLLDDVEMSVTEVMGSYETFRQQVYRMIQNDIEVGPLMSALGDVPYPIFFKGKDEDRYQLEFGPDGSPIIFGFRELLDRISR